MMSLRKREEKKKREREKYQVYLIIWHIEDTYNGIRCQMSNIYDLPTIGYPFLPTHHHAVTSALRSSEYSPR
jgi:hypothetical protein